MKRRFKKAKIPPALAEWSLSFDLTSVIRWVRRRPPALAEWSFSFRLSHYKTEAEIEAPRDWSRWYLCFSLPRCRVNLRLHAAKAGGIFAFLHSLTKSVVSNRETDEVGVGWNWRTTDMKSVVSGKPWRRRSRLKLKNHRHEVGGLYKWQMRNLKCHTTNGFSSTF